MNKHKHTLILSVALFLFLAPVAVLWSWNTLVELFGWPAAQYKHAFATVVLLLSVRWLVLPGRLKGNKRSGQMANSAA
jgi:hypothetical protein